MTRFELEDVTRRWISLDCTRGLGVIRPAHADDFEDLSSAGREPTKQDFALGLKQLIEAFPDLTTRVEDLVIDEMAQR
jgi:hypothetical protein